MSGDENTDISCESFAGVVSALEHVKKILSQLGADDEWVTQHQTCIDRIHFICIQAERLWPTRRVLFQQPVEFKLYPSLNIKYTHIQSMQAHNNSELNEKLTNLAMGGSDEGAYDEEGIIELLEKGANPNVIIEDEDMESGMHILFFAWMTHRTTLLELLLWYGADVSFGDMTLFQRAVENDHLTLYSPSDRLSFRQLIQHYQTRLTAHKQSQYKSIVNLNAKLDLIDEHPNDHMLLWVVNNQLAGFPPPLFIWKDPSDDDSLTDIIRLRMIRRALETHKANPNDRSNLKRTFTYEAVRRKKIHQLLLLYHFKADMITPQQNDDRMISTVQYADEQSFDISSLPMHTESFWTFPHSTDLKICYTGFAPNQRELDNNLLAEIEKLKKLSEHEVKLNENLEKWLKQGAYPDIRDYKDSNSNTGLYYAEVHSKKETVDLFLKYGADICVKYYEKNPVEKTETRLPIHRKHMIPFSLPDKDKAIQRLNRFEEKQIEIWKKIMDTTPCRPLILPCMSFLIRSDKYIPLSNGNTGRLYRIAIAHFVYNLIQYMTVTTKDQVALQNMLSVARFKSPHSKNYKLPLLFVAMRSANVYLLRHLLACGLYDQDIKYHVTETEQMNAYDYYHSAFVQEKKHTLQWLEMKQLIDTHEAAAKKPAKKTGAAAAAAAASSASAKKKRSSKK